MSSALFDGSLYASLLLCVLGLSWRCANWFRHGIGRDAREFAPTARAAALLRDAGAALFSARSPRILAVFFLDTLLLRRLYANAKLRWFAHLLIVVGFVALVLMHALAPLVSAKLFPGYASTLEPYLFLRNLFGVMLAAGIVLILLARGRRQTGFVRPRRGVDLSFITLLCIVLGAGFLLEASKIASPSAFYRMTGQYLGTTDAQKLKPLRALWASEYGVVFTDLREPPDPELVRQGRALHAEACASCHARPAGAFVSYPLAHLLGSLGVQARVEQWLLYLHVYACFLGLASLAFTGFFHIVAAPFNLLVDAAAGRGQFTAAGRAARRGLTLDACVRCGICDAHCAVAPLARYLGNRYLLPSHKLVATGTLAGVRPPNARQSAMSAAVDAQRAADGAFLCTDCGRCTGVCPVGLDLADLWPAGRADLSAVGFAAPAQRARAARAWSDSAEAAVWTHMHAWPGSVRAPLAADRDHFARCVQCQTCTNVCPVVANGMAMGHGIDLTPQKVMNLLRLGLLELTLGSRMVWSCATCYQCQQHCPEGIRVADIMCELRSVAIERLAGAARAKEAT